MNSPLAYIGGKSKLSKTIIEMIPNHRTYCEVFAGAAWVFFRKDYSKYEVINDIDSDLIRFYRVLQNHLEEFLRQFKWLLSSREWFDDWKCQMASKGLTDIQRAARYYYLQRQAFGGNVRNRTFGVSPNRPPRINLLRMEEELSQVHLRLINATIENLSWEAMLARYDRKETFFFLDPPYYKAPCYTQNMDMPDYENMARHLARVKGRFILTINDCYEMREVFGGFIQRRVGLNYTVAKGAQKKVRELIIGN
jgi:DNA adenine methylase